MTLTASKFEISTGYIGSMGVTFRPATDSSLLDAIRDAAILNNKSQDEIIAMLESGTAVNWKKSPNFYYDHSYGMIRPIRTIQQPTLVKCSCGHSVPKSQVMSASLGSSCPDCYDRMSN